MNYAAIKNCDIANGPGVRVSLFVSGCTHHCKGCFQPETWDFAYGQEYTPDTMVDILNMLAPSYISGLSILGGEPMDIHNMADVFALTHAVVHMLPEKTIWLYSGSTFEELMSRTDDSGRRTQEIFKQLDILVDGPFIEEKKDLSLQFRGSSNQRIIDMKETLRTGKIVLWDAWKERN